MSKKTGINKKYALILMLILSTSLGAVGQLLFKYAVLGRSISIPYLATGVALYALATAIYLFVLSRSHLSWAYSLGGLSYIFAVLFAAVFLHEAVGARWIGVGLIAIGAALVGVS
jgi:uncharacterized membrane protein